jgi:hypothetical protein
MGGRRYFKGSTSIHGSFLSSPRKFLFFLQHQQPATHIGIVKVIIKLAKVMRLAKQEKHESSAQSTTTILHTFPTPQFRDIRTMWYDHANIHSEKFLEKFLMMENICLKTCLNLFGLSYDVDKSSESSFEKPQWYFTEEHYIRKKEMMIINVLNFMIHRLGQNST